MPRSWGDRLQKKAAKFLDPSESFEAGMLVIRVGRIERPVWSVEPSKRRTPPVGVPETVGAVLPLAGVIGLTNTHLHFYGSTGSRSLRKAEESVLLEEVVSVATTEEPRFFGVTFRFRDGSNMAYDAPKAGRPTLFLDAMKRARPELFS